MIRWVCVLYLRTARWMLLGWEWDTPSGDAGFWSDAFQHVTQFCACYN